MVFFFFSFFFKILILQVVRGVKEQKMSQNDKTICLLHSISQEAQLYDHYFWYTCVKWWHLQMLFSFLFKILIFWVVRGGQKGKKWPKMTKNSINFTPYLRKCWNLQQVFTFFENFDFSGFLGSKRAKNDSKLPNSICYILYLRNCRSDDIIKIIISLGVFLHFLRKIEHCKY